MREAKDDRRIQGREHRSLRPLSLRFTCDSCAKERSMKFGFTCKCRCSAPAHLSRPRSLKGLNEGIVPKPSSFSTLRVERSRKRMRLDCWLVISDETRMRHRLLAHDTD